MLEKAISRVSTRGRCQAGARSRLTALVSLCALTGVLALGETSAQATITHSYLSRITEVPASSGAPLTGGFRELSAMTVDAGELYVADGQGPESRLDTFNDVSGTFISQFPHVSSLSYLYQGVAVGHATGEGEVYIGGDESENGPEGSVAVFGAAGKLQNVWKGADTPAGAFGCFNCNAHGSIAVDSSGNPLTKGDVYVLVPEQGVVDVFEPKAGGGEKYLTQLTGPEPEAHPELHFGVPYNGNGIAVDQSSGDVLVVDGSAVDVFEPTVLSTYTLVRRLTGTPGGMFEGPLGVAADGGSGEIYVSETRSGVIDQFSPAGVYLGHLTGTSAGPFSEVQSVAVDPTTHRVYVGDRGRHAAVADIFGPSVVVPDVTTEPASSLKARSATLNGTVDPDEAGAATCRFEWGTSTEFGRVAPCEPEGVADGNSPVPVHAALSGLEPDTTYHYRLQAGNANGTNPGEASQDGEFTTPGPGIHEESASIVTSSSATLNAEIDPHGTSTAYYFQYGTDASYGSSVPAAPGLDLGSSEGDLSVSVHLQGLAASTTYHYHVVAVSEPNGELVTVEGPDETFSTQAAGTEVTPPDSRAWEMVSPPNKQGAGIVAVGNEQGSDIQASANGGAITYTATAPFVANPAGSRAIEVTQVISARHAPGSWETADITTPHNEGSTPLAGGHSAEYKLFSADLSLGLVEPAGETPLPPLPPGSEKTVYFRAADGEYKALVTSGNVPPGTKIEGNEEGNVQFVSATPDFGHVVLVSKSALVPPPAPPEGVGFGEGGLYEWTSGQLKLVSVLPGGQAVRGRLGDEALGMGGDARHAISDDGSRVVWESGEGRHHFYVRDTTREETLQIDAAQGMPEPEMATTHYRTADGEDSRVFFTSTARLTADSDASEGQEDLYEFEVTSGKGDPLAGRLTDLTVDGNAEESAGVQGVIGASEDGSYVYFVANGVLGDGAGRGAASGADNLYVEHYDEGAKAWAQPVFIAVLAGGDAPSWGEGRTNLTRMTSRVSPDGGYLAFMSERSLTGYENRDANGGAPDEEVFLYDVSTGRLVCASCNPTGARPAGMHRGSAYEESLVDYAEIWQGRWLAGNIPGWTNKDLNSALYQSRYLSDSGRLFFDSADALVPSDVNGKEDVYEYEPAEVGSCRGPGHGQSASVVFSEALGGCVALISAGTSSEESAFMDASETGGDVFFLTLSRLAPQDYDTSIDLYDAHECTPSSPCAPPAALAPPPCTTGDACRPAPTPQPTLFGAPSSETFSGAGNIVPSTSRATVAPRTSTRARKLAHALRVCRKKPKRRRAGCELKARKRYRATQSRVGKGPSARTGR
jgi:hypothetical protein